MSCRDHQDRFLLSLYDELPDSDRVSLESHIQGCASCAAAVATHREFHSVMVEDAASWEMPVDLLVDSRRELADALDRIEVKRSWWRMPSFSVVLTPMRMLESAALIAMGLALGVFITHQRPVPAASTPSFEPAISSIPHNGVVSNLRIVSADLTTGSLELAGQVMQPLSIQGRIDDAAIRNLLVSAMRDADNPGARMKAVEVLAHDSKDHSIQEVLADALEHDSNAGVRKIALDGLRPFANEAVVRDAFIYALRNDEVPGIRVAAVETLTALSKDEALNQTIRDVTKDDDNPYIRMKGNVPMRLVGAGQ